MSADPSYNSLMKTIGDAVARSVLTMTGRKSPWGSGDKSDPESSDGSGNDGDGASGGDQPRGPRNPWLPPGEQRPRRSAGIEDIFRPREPGQQRSGGGGGGGGNFPRMPQRPGGKSWLPLVMGGIAVVWLLVTTTHMVGPKEEGIVTTFGKYSHTIGPGVSWTFPWPIQNVAVTDVTSIKRDTIPEGDSEKLMLTSDQNLIDLSYLVRWNINDLQLYSFRLADPEQTVREVAEAAMRASVAEVTLVEAMGGAGRAQIEQNVSERMQAVLDTYRSGVLIQGVEIKKADPPAKVIGAFQQVTAAQQDAQRDLSNAQAWSQQLLARAAGDAAAFDKVYEEYKLAPEVTRRRMYYETMERVLATNDKVIVEADGVTPYLPLQEVRRRQTDTAATPAPSPSSTQGGGQ